MKRVLALALCLCMVLGLMPVLASAEPAPQQTTVTAQELPGTSRLDDVQLPQKEDHRLYADDETVTVLVELQEQPLIAGFVPKGEGSVGLQMSEYLTAAAPEAAAMKTRQDEVVSLMAKAVGMELAVQKRYVNAVNAVFLRIHYGKLDELRAVEGVKTAHVQRIFDRPVTAAGIADEGTHGYSYDMTGLESVWNAGYTGQGMLVAVMDTGLDLHYTTWGNFETGVRRVHEAFTDDSFRSELNDAQLRYTNGSLARFLQSQQLIATTGIDGELVRTSSNPEVATVDEFGKVKAIAPGQTTVTVSKGEREAVCIVAVRERCTEILDFNLSIDHFSGLKPNGSVIVKVTDLQPANAVIEDVRWEINEDDPDLYVGLINVARYDTTGLVGEIFLNYTATGDPEIHVPGASATLDVTLNGVTRSMTIDWTDLYTYSDEDDLVSDLPFFEQTLYITHGETAELTARYANSALHEASDVKFYTAEGYIDYDYNNVTDPQSEGADPVRGPDRLCGGCPDPRAHAGKARPCQVGVLQSRRCIR